VYYKWFFKNPTYFFPWVKRAIWILEYNLYFFPQFFEHFAINKRYILTVKYYSAGCGFVKVHECLAKRRFSAAAFADQTEGFPPKDVDIDSIDGPNDKSPLFQREMLLQSAYLEQNILIFHFVPPFPDRSSERCAAFLH